MRTIIKSFSFAASLVMSFLTPCSVRASDCENITVRLSGMLSSQTPMQPQPVDEEPEALLVSIPLEAIGADDALLTAKFRRAQELIWVVDVLSANRSSPEEDKSFKPSLIRVDFTANGMQAADQQFTIQPLSNNESASRELVTVRVQEMVYTDGPSNVQVRAIDRAPGNCPDTGRIVSDEEVNGGRPVEVHQYQGAQGDEAMRANWLKGQNLD